MIPRYKCLIVDHDDTAVQSTAEIHHPAHIEVIHHFRPGMEPVDLDTFFLKNFDPGILEFYSEELGFSEAEIREEHRIWQEYVAGKVPDFYPGFLEMLADFRRTGGVVAVASHSEKAVIERDYRASGDFFPDAIFGWSFDETRRKPHPWPIEEISRHYSIPSEQVLVLDDLRAGVDMADTAGADAAAAGWAHNIPEIRKIMKERTIAFFERVEDFRKFLLEG